MTKYSIKTVLCAAAGGAIALTVTWFSWDARNIKPEPVDGAPKQIAIEAPKTLGRHAASSNRVAEAPKRVATEAPKTLNHRAESTNLVAAKQIAAVAPNILGFPGANSNLEAVAPKQFAAEPPKPLSFPVTSSNLEAMAPKQVATEAQIALGFHVASANLSAVPPVPSSPFKEDWYLVPPNKAALVLFVPHVASDRVVVVRDEMGKLLDSVDAKSGLPLLRQYRLDPGTYELNLKGFASLMVSIKAGKTATIQLSQTGISVTRKLPHKEQLTKDGIQDGNSEPQHISSAEKILYFTAELPSHNNGSVAYRRP